MGLAENFNPGYVASRENDYVLRIQLVTTSGSDFYYSYDFMGRMMTATTGRTDAGIVIMPFSQLDPETLETFRDKLVELGGHPPPLPEFQAMDQNDAVLKHDLTVKKPVRVIRRPSSS